MTLWPLTIAAVMLLWASATRLHADEASYTVLPPTQIMHLGRLCSRSGPGLVSEGWQPTPEQIVQAEALLPAFVRANRRPKEPLGGHHRRAADGGNRLQGIAAIGQHIASVRQDNAIRVADVGPS